MPLEINVTGLQALQGELLTIAEEMGRSAAEALFVEANIEMTEAKQRTPVATGALRASGVVLPVEHEGDEFSCVLQFGGPAVDYAIFVHEDLEAYHKVGQAKFLESVVNESAPHLADRVVARMRGR